MLLQKISQLILIEFLNKKLNKTKIIIWLFGKKELSYYLKKKA